MPYIQQDKIYEAERALPDGDIFETVEQAQAYVDAVRDTWWWRKFYYDGPARVEVYFSPPVGARSTSVGRYERDKDAGLIDLRPGGRNLKTLLHELAHVLASALNGSTSHDPFFARTYAVLVYVAMGPQAWLTLQGSYDECGVEYMQNIPEQDAQV